MEKQMHLAAQYLAAAGISFLDKKEDDSHTNLGFSPEKGFMSSRPLSDSGEILALDYNEFALSWISDDSSVSFDLDGRKHSEVLEWITKMVGTLAVDKPYSYNFHYEIDCKITPDFTFQLSDFDRLSELKHLRTVAQSSLKSFLDQHGLSSEVRIWPHHFDTGAFATLANESNTSIGLGLAIPDTICTEHYFYIGGYHAHGAIDTTNFDPLHYGVWQNDAFKGAILKATKIDHPTAHAFFNNALEAYLN